MKHLHELSQTDKIKLAAELDGVDYDSSRKATWWREGQLKYATSYDAIIPLVQKYLQGGKMQHDFVIALARIREVKNSYDFPLTIMATPSQLLDALLVATGKATL